MTQDKVQKNIEEFETLMAMVNRDGADKLMDYIRKHTDFYSAPASTRFHLSCEGGLLQHSLNVYHCLISKRNNAVWQQVLKDIPDESFIVMALLHDFCKANFYKQTTRNQKTYDEQKVSSASPSQVKHDDNGNFIWETVPSYEICDTMPLGHGEKSVMLIQAFMALRLHEIFAIRWHMGFSEEKANYKPMGEAMERYPVVLALHEADLEASKILESDSGNKGE